MQTLTTAPHLPTGEGDAPSVPRGYGRARAARGRDRESEGGEAASRKPSTRAAGRGGAPGEMRRDHGRVRARLLIASLITFEGLWMASG